MNREQMMDRLIESFGFEDNRVIWFGNLCELYEDNEWNNKCLEGIFGSLLDLAQYESELN